MSTKRQILTLLRLVDLREALSHFELSVEDGRVKEQVVDALAGSRTAPLNEILTLLSRATLKKLCRDLELDDRGRAKADLIARIIPTPSTSRETRLDQPASAAETDRGRELASVRESAPGAGSGRAVTNYLDSLLRRIPDEHLQAELQREVAVLRSRKEFGLVFEKHLPEVIRLHSHPIRRGATVQVRSEPDGELWHVKKLTAAVAALQRVEGAGPNRSAPVKDLVVVRSFGTPIYPGLTSLGKVERGADRPWHSVIQAENYHAIEMLLYAYEGRVDCIYIDPPYNTGAKDWKYNNDFVDSADAFRHSKWLSFMEKRLRLARRLLQPDGVLICTIDEHEVHHLGLLLETLFAEADRQAVSIVINPKGVTKPGSVRFSRVEEYAFFCFFGSSGVSGRGDDLLTNDISEEDPATRAGSRPRWKGLLRSGTDARRQDRPNMVLPNPSQPPDGRGAGSWRSPARG